MATHNNEPALSPDDARKALEMADKEESTTVNRPVPGWYFPLLAVLVLVMFLLNTVEEPSGALRAVVITLTLATAVAVAVLVGRVSFHQPGYEGVQTPWRGALLGMVVAAALALTPVLLAATIGTWIWAACGIALSILIAGFGIAYWRRYPRA